jgi:hypothetical protein
MWINGDYTWLLSILESCMACSGNQVHCMNAVVTMTSSWPPQSRSHCLLIRLRSYQMQFLNACDTSFVIPAKVFFGRMRKPIINHFSAFGDDAASRRERCVRVVYWDPLTNRHRERDVSETTFVNINKIATFDRSTCRHVTTSSGLGEGITLPLRCHRILSSQREGKGIIRCSSIPFLRALFIPIDHLKFLAVHLFPLS